MQILQKIIFYTLLFLTFQSFGAHPFYVSIYQLKFASEKQMLQITSRIFLDDAVDALQDEYQAKVYLGESNESEKDVTLLKKYLLKNFSIQINDKSNVIEFLSHEVQDNVLICYLRIKNIKSIDKIKVTNSVLIDLFPNQQNIIQLNISNQKKNLTLTESKISGELSFKS